MSQSRWTPEFKRLESSRGPLEITVTQPEDPAYALLQDGHTSAPEVFRDYCYICRDPEFAQMGLPLCKLCPVCKTGHVPADDEECSDCGANIRYYYDGLPPTDNLVESPATQDVNDAFEVE